MNFKKIRLINKRQWRENASFYRVGICAIAAVLPFLFFIVWHWRDSFSGDAHRGIFLIGLFGGGCLFAAFLFKEVPDPMKGLWILALPASAAEKILVIIVYATVIYAFIFTSVFLGTEAIFVWIIDPHGEAIQRTDLLYNSFYNFIFYFFNFQLLILLGNLIFRKAALIKTILVMIAYFAISNTSNNYVLKKITGQSTIDGGSLFDYFQFRHQGENVYVYLPKNIDMVVSISFNYLLPLALCYILFLKFRETEL